MKKIFFWTMTMVMLLMVAEIRETIKEKQNKPEIKVPQIESYVFDQAVFTEEEVNLHLKKILGNQIPDFNVSFENGGIIEVNLSLDEKFNELINPQHNVVLLEALKLFEGEQVRCSIQINEDLEFNLIECTAAEIPVPNSLLDGMFQAVSKKMTEILQNAGVESMDIKENQLKIRGELKQVMGYLNE